MIAYSVFLGYTKEFREKAASYDLGDIGKVERPNIILDRRFNEVGRMFVQNRSEVPIEQVPQKMIDALVAGEDSRFFTHDGVDYVGVARAAIGNFKSKNADSGASTITMQLARNAFPLQADVEADGGNKYDRKFVEIYLSQLIEEKFSKDQIMEFYLNRIPFSKGYFGIRSASLGFFGKEPRDLEVWECASLVGCIKNPSVFSPFSNPENHKKSRDNVLNRMRIEGFITPEDCEIYKDIPIALNPKPIERGTSYFYDRVAQFVKDNIPEEQLEGGGLKIFTTLDNNLQKTLEGKIQDQLFLIEEKEGYEHPLYKDFKAKTGKTTNYLQGAGLCYNHKTGEVLAYVGGRNFKHSQYDFIQAGQRPLGTIFLPIVYASSIENGGSMATPVIDEAMDNRMVMVSGQEGILAEWGEETMDPLYRGFIPAREGLANSKIAATVRLGKEVGLDKVAQTAEKFGFKMPKTLATNRVLARGLIGSESGSVLGVSQAYASFANGGKKPERLIWVSKVVNQYGDTIYTRPKKVETEKIMEEDQSYLVHSALNDVWTYGNLSDEFSKDDLFDFKGGVKTGTTYNFADHWAVGYNGDITCAVWSGFFSGNKAIYDAAFAKDTVLPVWKEVMKKASIDYKPYELKPPENLEAVLVCSRSGLKCTPDCYEQRKDAVSGKINFESTGVTEFFEKGTAPTSFCDIHGDFGGDTINVALNSEASANELLYVLPIQPKVLALSGEDPYGVKVSSFDPFGQKSTDNRTSGKGVVLDEMFDLDTKATIFQPRPGRVFIDE